MTVDVGFEQDVTSWIEGLEEFKTPCQRGEFCLSEGEPAEYLAILAAHGSCGVLRRLFCAEDAGFFRMNPSARHVACGVDHIPVLSITPL